MLGKPDTCWQIWLHLLNLFLKFQVDYVNDSSGKTTEILKSPPSWLWGELSWISKHFRAGFRAKMSLNLMFSNLLGQLALSAFSGKVQLYQESQKKTKQRGTEGKSVGDSHAECALACLCLVVKMVEMVEIKSLGKCSKSVSVESKLINDFTGLHARDFLNIIFSFGLHFQGCS